MVLERRLYYGFTGNQVPVVPRASRSARGRRPIGRKCEANKIHAFEILASVAGDLLQDDFSVPSSVCKNAQINVASNNAEWDRVSEGKLLTEEPSEEGEICEKKLDCVPMLQGHRHSCSLDGFLHAQESITFEGSLALQKFDHSGNMSIGDNMDTYRRTPGKNQGDLTYADKCWEDGLEYVIEEKTEDGLSSKIKTIGSSMLNVKGSLVGAEEPDMSQPLSISSQSNTEESLFMDFMGLTPFSGKRVDVNPVTVDDDDNSVGCSQGGIVVKDYRPSPHIRDRRIRKVSASRYCKVPPNKKGGGYCRTDGKAKPNYYSGRASYVHQRSQKIFPFKKRKFFDQCEFYCEDVTSPDRRTNDENCRRTKIHASGESSSLAGQHQSMDCNVKLSINSFKVPELFVEVPATATVGSLKRTVLEAVSAILGDGLHVGILLQGKKVRDDSKTLFQTGISQDDKRRSLGFMLEPTHSQVAPPSGTEDHPFLSGRAAKRLSRHATSLTIQQGNSGCSLVRPDVNFQSHTASEFGANAPIDDSVSDSKALVAVPAISMEALAVVPYNRKSGHNEFVQRRMRRPFSVSEVEALVQAVEKLGTGRWRDVKLRAFNNANHRTYVDLKDKWKTLVHTARISPQQRRGEPVPQELLDRVLAAHAYWSQQQVKQLAKAAV